MAIRNRRGVYSDFDKTKMVDGEFAVVKSGDPDGSGKAVYISFQSGTADRLALFDDLEEYVEEYGGKIDAIKKNGEELPIVDKTVNISVPTKTSDLTNDGDGTSKYATEDDTRIVLSAPAGDIVEFSTGGDNMPMKAVEVSMSPIQDLNGYSSPWPAGGGKNKLDINNRHSSSNDHILVCNCSLDAGTYTISATVESTSPSEKCLVLLVYEDNTNSENAYLSNNTRSSVTITATKKVMRVRFYSATNYNTSQNYTIQMSNAQIESGSTATAWEPYSNVCPITGRTGASVVVVGKNLFADKGQGYWRVSDGAFITSGATAQRYRSCEKIPVIAGAQYTGFVKSTYDQPTSVYVQWWEADGTGREVRVTQLPVVVVAPDDAVLMSFAFRFESPEIASEAVNVIQVEAGSTPTEYEENKTTTYPITFTSAGTVYAGTMDLVSGRLEVTHGMYAFASASDIYQWSTASTGAFSITSQTIADAPVVGSMSMISNQYKKCVSSVPAATEYAMRSVTGRIVIYDPRFTSRDVAEQLIAANQIQVLYPLATPLTYTLTPTQVMSLLGENVVWSPDGTISNLKYSADISLVIADLYSKLSS